MIWIRWQLFIGMRIVCQSRTSSGEITAGANDHRPLGKNRLRNQPSRKKDVEAQHQVTEVRLKTPDAPLEGIPGCHDASRPEDALGFHMSLPELKQLETLLFRSTQQQAPRQKALQLAQRVGIFYQFDGLPGFDVGYRHRRKGE